MNATILNIAVETAAQEGIKHLRATLSQKLGAGGLEAALECVNRARSILRRAIDANQKPTPAKNKPARNQKPETTRPQAI
jgi:hypothetical protein